MKSQKSSEMQTALSLEHLSTIPASKDPWNPLLHRLFYSSSFDKTMKVGASVVIARRGGCSATFYALNKFFTISGMPVGSSHYWNSVHGVAPGDAEGIQTVRVLARNMTFLMKSIALGREKFGLPEKEDHLWTNFI